MDRGISHNQYSINGQDYPTCVLHGRSLFCVVQHTMVEIRRKPVASVTSWPVEPSPFEIQSAWKEDQSQHGGVSPPNGVFNNATPNASQPPTRRKHSILRNWVWEIVSAVFCLAIIIAIATLLARFDGKELPEWPLHINLNAAISILADVLKAALLLIAGAIISQSKWAWFSDRARPLNHIQRFEEASRSLMGSATLLFTAPSHFPTLFATLLTILAIAVGPFTQQAVQTKGCLQNTTETAYVPVAQNYGAKIPGTAQIGSPDIFSSVMNGLSNPKGDENQVSFVCPTGNCTFAEDSAGVTHASIALCSVCVDTTPLIEYTVSGKNFFQFDLPNATTIDSVTMLTVGQALDLDNWAASVLTDKNREAFQCSLYNTTIMAKTKQRPVTFTKENFNITKDMTVDGVVAATCGFYPCLQHYHAEVNKGVLSEKVVSSTSASKISYNVGAGGLKQKNDRNKFSFGNYTAMDEPCNLDGKAYTMANISEVERKPVRDFSVWEEDGKTVTAPTDCLYLYSRDYENGLPVLLVGKCDGLDAMKGGDLQCSNPIAGNASDGSSNLQNWWLNPLFNNATATFDTLNTAMGDLARVVTNNMRTKGGSAANWYEHQVVYGKAQKTTTCTRFEWRWLIFPIALTIVALVLLVWGIVVSYLNRGRPVWKDSLLPLLFYGLEGERNQRERAAQVQDLDAQARGTMVRLKLEDEMTGFVEAGSKDDEMR